MHVSVRPAMGWHLVQGAPGLLPWADWTIDGCLIYRKYTVSISSPLPHNSISMALKKLEFYSLWVINSLYKKVYINNNRYNR